MPITLFYGGGDRHNIKIITIIITITIIIKHMHLYFFKSTDEKDFVSKISIFTTTRKKAIALAYKYFAKCGYKGIPVILAV